MSDFPRDGQWVGYGQWVATNQSGMNWSGDALPCPQDIAALVKRVALLEREAADLRRDAEFFWRVIGANKLTAPLEEAARARLRERYGMDWETPPILTVGGFKSEDTSE